MSSGFGQSDRVVVIHGPADLALELLLLESRQFPVLYTENASVWVPDHMVPSAGSMPEGCGDEHP